MCLAVMSTVGCSKRVEPRPDVTSCAPLPDYPDYVLSMAAQELAYLPDGSVVERMLDDYRFLRRQLNEWHSLTCRERLQRTSTAK
jgi:hypothetical protein